MEKIHTLKQKKDFLNVFTEEMNRKEEGVYKIADGNGNLLAKIQVSGKEVEAENFWNEFDDELGEDILFELERFKNLFKEKKIVIRSSGKEYLRYSGCVTIYSCNGNRNFNSLLERAEFVAKKFPEISVEYRCGGFFDFAIRNGEINKASYIKGGFQIEYRSSCSSRSGIFGAETFIKVDNLSKALEEYKNLEYKISSDVYETVKRILKNYFIRRLPAGKKGREFFKDSGIESEFEFIDGNGIK